MKPTPDRDGSRRSADRTSARDAVQRALAAIDAERRLNAFVYVDRARALEQAEARDHRGATGALEGVPVAVKDNLAVAGQPLAAGSRVLEGLIAPEDAWAVAQLRHAGAIIVGRTNMDEFGMGSSSEFGVAGPVENPAAPGRVAGGSSGGSAAAVAAGAVPVALGSDTGGSIRQPAACCGVVGLRPTWGRVSRRGLVAFASSMDTVGPLARSVADAAKALAVIAGRDAGDATSARRPVDDLAAASGAGVRGLRVGRVRPHVAVEDPVGRAVDRAARALVDAGATVVDLELPHAPNALSTYMVVATAEASSNLARYDGLRYGRRTSAPNDLTELYERSRTEGLGLEVQRRILMGTYVLSEGHVDAYFLQAARVRTLIVRDYERAFSSVDVLLGPTTPGPAFARDSRRHDPIAMYGADELTVGPSLAGLPAISVPAGEQDDLPVGVQIVAPWFGEARLVAAGGAIEASIAQ